MLFYRASTTSTLQDRLDRDRGSWSEVEEESRIPEDLVIESEAVLQKMMFGTSRSKPRDGTFDLELMECWRQNS